MEVPKITKMYYFCEALIKYRMCIFYVFYYYRYYFLYTSEGPQNCTFMLMLALLSSSWPWPWP